MMRVVDLISPAYVAEQRYLHALPKGYGGKGHKWAATVAAIVADLGCGSVLDYGCGQGALGAALRMRGYEVRDYDPAIDGKDQPPSFADLVVCTDVLEHVEPALLQNVLTHLRQLARKAIFLVVALDPSNKVLTDGRNAHLIQAEPAWWDAEIVRAGMTVITTASDDDFTYPLPMAYDKAEKRSKRWIAVVAP